MYESWPGICGIIGVVVILIIISTEADRTPTTYALTKRAGSSEQLFSSSYLENNDFFFSKPSSYNVHDSL